jgi:hypothetical protein
MIKGIPVTLWERTQTGTDAFNAPVYTETAVTVENVLVTPGNQGGEDVIDALRLYGKHAEYVLSIPKGDAHDWTGRKIGFFGQVWRSFGLPTEYIEANVPLYWNRKVLVERYE